MTERDSQYGLGDDPQGGFSTDEACPGCGGDVVLVVADDGTTSAQCPCSAASVLVAA